MTDNIIDIPQVTNCLTIEVKRMDYLKERSQEFPLPVQAHIGDAGYDLRTTEDVILLGSEQVLVPTGFAWKIPVGYVGLIRDRSGHAFKQRLTVRAGVIDSTYRGEVKVLLTNESRKSVKIEAGERIAQMLVLPCLHAPVLEVEKLDGSSRGTGGFGSTGKGTIA